MINYEILGYSIMTPAQRRAQMHVVGADTLTDKGTVTIVQRQLRALSRGVGDGALDPGVSDGIIGPKTRAAVKAFNEKYGWPSDGMNITAGTLEALKRPDVTKHTGASVVSFEDDEVVVGRKKVVEEVKKAQEAVSQAADAKASAKTPEEMQKALVQVKAAEEKVNIVAKESEKAPPEVRAAIEEVQTAAKLVSAATSPEQMKMALGRVGSAEKKVQSLRSKYITFLAIGAVVGVLGLTGTILLAAKSKWLWAALNFFLFTPLALGTVAAAGAVSVSKEQV